MLGRPDKSLAADDGSAYFLEWLVQAELPFFDILAFVRRLCDPGRMQLFQGARLYYGPLACSDPILTCLTSFASCFLGSLSPRSMAIDFIETT